MATDRSATDRPATDRSATNRPADGRAGDSRPAHGRTGDSRPASPVAPDSFGPFDGRVWLNTAHQGPLPRVAVEAAARAASLKAAPHRIPDEAFTDEPERLRGLLATLVGGRVDEIVLGNSTSYGLQLVAGGLPWQSGDEVLVVDGDYPATVLPWSRLTDRGVHTRRLHPGAGAPTATELAATLTDATRVFALTWVNSFTGHAADLDALGRVCREAGVTFVVNASQAIGARPIDVSRVPVDAVASCGYKWLCGPYGTGFTWLRPGLRDRLRPQQAYWLAMQAGRGLDHMRDYTVRDDLGVRGMDVFCPANFANTLPWAAAIDLFLSVGVPAVAEYDQWLVDVLLAGIDPEVYEVLSPVRGPARSTLVVLARRDGDNERRYRQLAEAGVDVAYREGNLRLCPHLFTTPDEIDRALEVLHRPAS
ncbi:aminotransferase class V-fold PLP-dependent enzyme [Rugosimonospora africana]|uniref:Aminotransferase V n=1 Tax=Rugosimonospora africana TaxID=556532 RepID=A0A8J3QQ16_9ACTN|nr:aminotransferase class V-fold PLP-dependent enzyme [Rugosimonospora africana]GIH14819.1 aminotransferase V [Rugosimonospora africana]